MHAPFAARKTAAVGCGGALVAAPVVALELEVSEARAIGHTAALGSDVCSFRENPAPRCSAR